jgi:hypothetical protein
MWKGSLLLADFYLKYFILEGNLKITVPGRSPQEKLILVSICEFMEDFFIWSLGFLEKPPPPALKLHSIPQFHLPA